MSATTTSGQVNTKLKLINEARDVLRGSRNHNAAELTKLYQELEHNDQFAYATEVLLVKMKMDEDAGIKLKLEEYQKLAKYIYKDHSLPSAFKFNKAIQELGSHDDLARTINCETLGLTGAIYKRKWMFDHQFKNLILSRYYYKRGYASWKAFLHAAETGTVAGDDERNDDGYNAINYAYINELMSVDKLEEHGSITGLSESIDERLQEAASVREHILQKFIATDPVSKDLFISKPGRPWVVATVAEAYFGLCDYDNAKKFIKEYLWVANSEKWEITSFSQQIFSIAYLQVYRKRFIEKQQKNESGNRKWQSDEKQIDLVKIRECLNLFTIKPGEKEKDAEVKKTARTGLALSGGGFRASLFHIGVLAALAERDELRNIEIISCVSGGSIIGAYYYLKLKALLESQTDEEVTREDYITMVKEIEKEFLAGVQKNLRMRVFSNLISNFKMLRVTKYSRTHRIGEMYEEHLYKQLWQNNPTYKSILDANGGTIYMSDLFIRPKEKPEGFDISRDNWNRKNKIPQLVLNATSVNTGHNWQFTASWMGEPPGNIQADIDVKPRLRRMYYSEAPDQYKKFRLGYAVGASSCVPVMFHPMPLHGLYPGIDLQLIDGGLHDNQGIAALIEQECKNMIISDASGQMPTNTIATNNEAAVFYRADNILQERLRELQFMDIKERNYTTQINTLMTVHLKNDLQENPISWKYCTDPPRSIVYANTYTDNTDLTKYGLLHNTQTMLSEIRTDLDSFHDIEAYALMYSGYAQIHYEYGRLQEDGPDAAAADWNFLKIKDYVTLPARAEEISKPLATAKKLAFKVVDLSMPVRIFAILVGIAAAAGLLYLGFIFWDETLLTLKVKLLVYTFIGFLLGLVSKFVAALFSYKTTLRKYATFIIVMIVAWVFSNIYLWIFNGIYNTAGKLKEVKPS
jgi:predicted acylesterase/phospholipase RssA